MSPLVLGAMTQPTIPVPSGATHDGVSPVPLCVTRSTTPVPSAACMNRLDAPARCEENTMRRPSDVQTGL